MYIHIVVIGIMEILQMNILALITRIVMVTFVPSTTDSNNNNNKNNNNSSSMNNRQMMPKCEGRKYGMYRATDAKRIIKGRVLF